MKCIVVLTQETHEESETTRTSSVNNAEVLPAVSSTGPSCCSRETKTESITCQHSSPYKAH